MIGIIVVTHGDLAKEFLLATEHVVGDMENCASICIGADDDLEERRNDIRNAIQDVDEGEGVIILTDMFGGTPSNLAISLMQSAPNIEVLAGVNLPMLIKLAEARYSNGLIELAELAEAAGKRYVAMASKVLEGSAK